MSSQHKWTGERLETTITGETMVEHLHRYAIAQQFIHGKKVLDIACGEGYGSNLLAKHAMHVTGIDIDGPTIEKAKHCYPASNIAFKTGSILNIPSADNSFDIITCFETIEHLTDHGKMMSELKRVLVSGGTLLISTPEKLTYSETTGYVNPFHQKELYGNEFKELIERFFTYASFYTQCSFAGSFIQPEKEIAVSEFYKGDYQSITLIPSLPALYRVGIASDREIPPLAGSFFQQDKSVTQLLQEENQAMKKTITYRAGNFILSPFKFIRSLFNK